MKEPQFTIKGTRKESSMVKPDVLMIKTYEGYM